MNKDINDAIERAKLKPDTNYDIVGDEFVEWKDNLTRRYPVDPETGMVDLPQGKRKLDGVFRTSVGDEPGGENSERFVFNPETGFKGYKKP